MDYLYVDTKEKKMELKKMLDSFGVSSEAELIDKKIKCQQVKEFSLKKPTAATFTESECRSMCDDIGIKYSNGYEKRILPYIITNETTDRFSDIVRCEGVKFDNYMRNPVIQFSHNYKEPPIGNSLKVWTNKVEKNVQALGLFLDNTIDTTGLADLVFRMASSGFMRACSIGFTPLDAERPTKEKRDEWGMSEWGIEYKSIDLMEWSPCGIPANPATLQNAIKSLTTNGKFPFVIDDMVAAEKYNIFGDLNLLNVFSDEIKNNDGITRMGVVKKNSNGIATDNDDKKNNVTVNVVLDVKELTDIMKAVVELSSEIKHVADIILQKQSQSSVDNKKSLYGNTDSASIFKRLEIGKPNF
jgi:hypothetical protein